MYHIGKDKRQIQSAGLACNAMEVLMREKAYEDITITEISEQAGIGRATFYRLFDDKSDIVLYQIESIIYALAQQLPPDNAISGIDKMLYSMFDNFLAHRNLFLALVQASIYEQVQNEIARLLEERYAYLAQVIPMDNREWKYFVFVRIAMLFSAFRLAITQFPEDTTECILATLNHLFNGQQNIITAYSQQ